MTSFASAARPDCYPVYCEPGSPCPRHAAVVDTDELDGPEHHGSAEVEPFVEYMARLDEEARQR
jgi:hypothetical protein